MSNLFMVLGGVFGIVFFVLVDNEFKVRKYGSYNKRLWNMAEAVSGILSVGMLFVALLLS